MSDSVGGRRHPNFDVRRIGPGKLVRNETRRYDMPVREQLTEHSQREKFSAEKGSDEYLICEPCRREGNNFEAKGFCCDCKEYLCHPCFKSHSRSKASLYHSLLDVENMRNRPIKSYDLSEKAERVAAKSVEYVCGESRSKAFKLLHQTLVDEENIRKRPIKSYDPSETADERAEATGDYRRGQEYVCDKYFKTHSDRALREHELFDKCTIENSFDRNLSIVDASYYKDKEELSYIWDINVTTTLDKKDCFITRMALMSNTEIILADENNKTLMLFDIESNKITDSLPLQPEPYEITDISQKQVAVALGFENKIQIIAISLNTYLEEVRTHETHGFCVDVKYTKRKLYVSFKKPVKFQILELKGGQAQVCKTMKPDAEVLKHCIVQAYIAISSDERLIYISDWENNKVMCIDTNGNKVGVYGNELKYPTDITISSSGFIYLCNRDMNAVLKMPSDLSDSIVVLELQNRSERPEAFCFNAASRHLYISSIDSERQGYIKVYQWN